MGTPVVANIVYGNAWIYRSTVAAAVPDESVALATTWGGSWVRVGFTDEGVTMTYEDERGESSPQEVLTPVKRWKQAESCSIETVLSELTPDYLDMVVAAGAVTTTAQASGQAAYQDYNVGGQAVLDEYQWGIEATYRDSSGNTFPVRFFFWKGNATLNGGLEFAKDRDGGTGIPFRVDMLADYSKAAGQQLFRMQRVTTAAGA